MVIDSRIIDFGGMLLMGAQESVDPVFERLDPPRRAAVVMALLGLTLIGLFLITFVMIGGHWVRRLARHRPAPRTVSSSEVDNQQLPQGQQTILPDHKTGDTVLLDRPSNETRVET